MQQACLLLAGSHCAGKVYLMPKARNKMYNVISIAMLAVFAFILMPYGVSMPCFQCFEKDYNLFVADFDVRSLKESCRGKIRCLIRKNIHIYKGDLDVRRKKGPSERTEPRGFTQTMSQYLTRLHTGEIERLCNKLSVSTRIHS